MAARLPAGSARPLTSRRRVLALTVNPFITGTVVHVDGGQVFV
jgi:hypothetical protein